MNGPYYNMPFPTYYPVKTDESGYNYNPAGSIPGPAPRPSSVPGLWVGSKLPLQNRFADGTSPVFRTMTWSTPVFDLRPELDAAPGIAPTNSVPLWRQLFGTGGKLWLQVSGFNTAFSTKTGLRVRSTEFAHVIDPGAMAQIDDPEDVTAEAVGTAPSAIWQFSAPGGGYPCRFWRLEFTIEYLLEHADPNLVLEAAYY